MVKRECINDRLHRETDYSGVGLDSFYCTIWRCELIMWTRNIICVKFQLSIPTCNIINSCRCATWLCCLCTSLNNNLFCMWWTEICNNMRSTYVNMLDNYLYITFLLFMLIQDTCMYKSPVNITTSHVNMIIWHVDIKSLVNIVIVT